MSIARLNLWLLQVWDKVRFAWEDVKAFFKYSETILWARIQVLTGFLLTVFGAIDWSPFLGMNVLNTDFSWNQVAWLGIITITNGVITELVRRRNMKTINA